MNIAIDGPSGAGKSSLAKAIAKRLGIVYVDTGALYRTIGLYVKEKGVDPHDEAGVTALLPEIDLALRFEGGTQRIYLCSKDVGDSIRTPEMSLYASAVSAIGTVRVFLLETQRRVARECSVVMDGRDIGTVILPDAECKIFLTASSE
ncbi:MAG: (d)CMP kinase, partial [Clostridia bacterium]|nr:(d)CMP kinase [Clostridia bacterium]